MGAPNASPDPSPDQLAFQWAIYRRRMIAFRLKLAASVMASLSLVPLVGMMHYYFAAGPLGDFKPAIYDCLIWFLALVIVSFLLHGVPSLADMFTDLTEQRGCD